MIYLYKEENSYVAISWDVTTKAYFMHVVIKNWSLSEYKRYKKIFKIITDELKKLTPYVLSLCNGEKEFKFNKIFGFKDTGFIYFNIENGKTYKIARLDL